MKKLIILLFAGILVQAQTGFVGLTGTGFNSTSHAGESIIGKNYNVGAEGGVRFWKDMYAVGGISYRNETEKVSWYGGVKYYFEYRAFAQMDYTSNNYVRSTAGLSLFSTDRQFSVEPYMSWGIPVRGIGEILSFGMQINYFIK